MLADYDALNYTYIFLHPSVMILIFLFVKISPKHPVVEGPHSLFFPYSYKQDMRTERKLQTVWVI